MYKPLLLSIGLSSLFFPYGIAQKKETDINKEKALEFSQQAFHLSEVMLHDVANPPAAARFYAYSMLGAYVVVLNNTACVDWTKKFKVVPDFKLTLKPKQTLLPFCAGYAMLEVGKKIMPSGYLLKEKQAELVSLYKKRYAATDKDLKENIRYAVEAADKVVEYARSDGYNRLSTYTRYRPQNKIGHWYPTPPAYMGAIEPEWRTLRGFFLDSSAQFKPNPPAPFSLDKGSSFYNQMMEVYQVTRTLTDEQKQIANFWDCNPFSVDFSGHVAIGIKKISPGGHWIGITGIVCRDKGVPFDSTVMAHTLVSLALHDAFISCWDEKYRSDRIRPETAINKNHDQQWRPLLQTPPFPEYTSGHSVISNASAMVLTYFFGDNVPFIDTSEAFFGLPPRPFPSFFMAAEEAAVSRLYGGIHFRDAIEEGVQQGKNIGRHIVKKITAPQN